jgi:hypothetical protein
MQDTRCRIENCIEQRAKSEDKMLDSRYWMLDARYKVQEIR